MRSTFLVSVATAALIGSAGIVSAQGPSGGASGAPAASQSAPSGATGGAAEKAAPANRGDASPGGGMKGGQTEKNGQRAQDNAKDDMKSKGAESTRDQKGGKAASETNMDRSKDGTKADQKNASDKNGMKDDRKNAADRNGMKGEQKTGATTGQAGAGAKLSTEQRTTIRTSITKQNIQPVTNINFAISVGTRVPRSVSFHPLPADVVTVYPDWRGYEFFLVREQIVVVNPRTLEIVAVLDA